MGRGEGVATKRLVGWGGQVNVNPYFKKKGGGGRKSFSHAEGWPTNNWGSFKVGIYYLPMLNEGGAKGSHFFKGGDAWTVLSYLNGGGGWTKVGPTILPFCTYPLFVIKHRSLNVDKDRRGVTDLSYRFVTRRNNWK